MISIDHSTVFNILCVLNQEVEKKYTYSMDNCMKIITRLINLMNFSSISDSFFKEFFCLLSQLKNKISKLIDHSIIDFKSFENRQHLFFHLINHITITSNDYSNLMYWKDIENNIDASDFTDFKLFKHTLSYIKQPSNDQVESISQLLVLSDCMLMFLKTSSIMIPFKPVESTKNKTNTVEWFCKQMINTISSNEQENQSIAFQMAYLWRDQSVTKQSKWKCLMHCIDVHFNSCSFKFMFIYIQRND